MGVSVLVWTKKNCMVGRLHFDLCGPSSPVFVLDLCERERRRMNPII